MVQENGPLVIGNLVGNPREIVHRLVSQPFEIAADGSAVVLTGSSSHGQGHHTAFAQVASEVTGIPVERIEVRHGDVDREPGAVAL